MSICLEIAAKRCIQRGKKGRERTGYNINSHVYVRQDRSFHRFLSQLMTNVSGSLKGEITMLLLGKSADSTCTYVFVHVTLTYAGVSAAFWFCKSDYRKK